MGRGRVGGGGGQVRGGGGGVREGRRRRRQEVSKFLDFNVPGSAQDDSRTGGRSEQSLHCKTDEKEASKGGGWGWRRGVGDGAGEWGGNKIKIKM